MKYDEAKLQDIIDWAERNLRPDLDPRNYALCLIREDEEGGEELSLELHQDHTISGNPVADRWPNPEIWEPEDEA